MNNSYCKPTSLSDWQLVKVSGTDNRTFLQGQVTADINHLNEHTALFAAHCDAKGRMWSNLILFQRGADIFYIVRKTVAEKQIAALKKYAVFSKVTIEPVVDLNLIGLENNAIEQSIIAELGDNSCITKDDITYIKIPLPEMRLIKVSNEPLPTDSQTADHWLKLDLEAGYAIIDEPNIESLLPQACNLQHYNAISFDKGCYCGQEMVARAQFRGANNRGLYLLVGKSKALPIIGDKLEYELDGNWREGGQVLAALKLGEDDEIYVQVVLANGIDIETNFRVKGQPNSLLNF
ncbi:tRNA-modifying protein YgfZ [Gilliamella sp. B14384H2]|uniref:tRNA-modifying protein YgfZ n=1 Tax=unclassified Gilliamella TaxID=2685620 RepID=UPI0018DE83C8|nr:MULTISPECIES: tRNA-modifying protein YgfZ [unclassified Gilliamella]MBI0037947.1 tRNA-modifying protein YgfZ [Gilliamella sp. B14384G10]MBI0039942.1 tRNA-modifying protein YgfZ [Gilliamella sp. B14384G7]MBI0051782.1 tRNA-modifying protein YgfZ [Gilliamella sp. B14384G13]MBI0054234.1 tRNA-modifying protein YgfZ [Gilliamella sp. B14384H2]